MPMLNIWNFKNTFANKLLPHAYNYLNNNYISQKHKDFTLCFAKTIYAKNTEIINHYVSFIDRPSFHSSLIIEENDWKYPFPHGFIPENLSIVCTNICFKDNKNNLRDRVQEKITVYLHKPNPYKINGNYSLSINSEKIVSNMYYEVPMDFRGIDVHKFTHDERPKKLMHKLCYFLKNQ